MFFDFILSLISINIMTCYERHDFWSKYILLYILYLCCYTFWPQLYYNRGSVDNIHINCKYIQHIILINFSLTDREVNRFQLNYNCEVL